MSRATPILAVPPESCTALFAQKPARRLKSEAPAECFDWRELGQALLERESVGVAVLCADGRVVRLNQGFRALFSGEVDRPGLASADLWHPVACAAWKKALAAARRGKRERVIVTPRGPAVAWDPVVEVSLLGKSPESGFLVVVVDTVPRHNLQPLNPVAGRTYEVALTPEGRPGTLLRLTGPDGCESRGDGRACHEVFHGRSTPCDGCALGTPGGLRVQLQPRSPGGFSALVRVARKVGPGNALVTEFGVDQPAWEELIAARVEHLATLAALGEREADILRLLLLGRSVKEVATATGLSPRNAKYHSQAVLRKVGAESRADLLRLLM